MSVTDSPASSAAPEGGALMERLGAFVTASRRLLVLTGAGCSTDSGIPDYRDERGAWKRKQPIQLQEFLGSATARRRYWARSLVGWERIVQASPNRAHTALAQLEWDGRLHWLITQNVDGLHLKAGNRRVTELHGSLDAVDCLECGARLPRTEFQQMLEELNPRWASLGAATAPDGDADLAEVDYSTFVVPDCPCCLGTLKPAVVFFGESVPQKRVEYGFARLREADAVLVVGSSLMVWSGYRFVKRARDWSIPVAAINIGRTRADRDLCLKVGTPCGKALDYIARTGLSGQASDSRVGSHPEAIRSAESKTGRVGTNRPALDLK